MVRLKEFFWVKIKDKKWKFQFLDGAIKSASAWRNAKEMRYFNSLMVRLKG